MTNEESVSDLEYTEFDVDYGHGGDTRPTRGFLEVDADHAEELVDCHIYIDPLPGKGFAQSLELHLTPKQARSTAYLLLQFANNVED
jgi:hypothetical protein